MDKNEMHIKKICCLYVSDWHLSVMLLPYINKQINKDVGITTIFKNNEEENIKALIKKLNLKNSEKILNLDFTKREIINLENIEKIINKVNNHQEIIIINNGNIDEIEKTNIYIEEIINKNKMYNKNIKIINCYEISDINENVNNVIKKYNTVLNTSGENDINKILA